MLTQKRAYEYLHSVVPYGKNGNHSNVDKQTDKTRCGVDFYLLIKAIKFLDLLHHGKTLKVSLLSR